MAALAAGAAYFGFGGPLWAEADIWRRFFAAPVVLCTGAVTRRAGCAAAAVNRAVNSAVNTVGSGVGSLGVTIEASRFVLCPQLARKQQRTAKDKKCFEANASHIQCYPVLKSEVPPLRSSCPCPAKAARRISLINRTILVTLLLLLINPKYSFVASIG